MHAGPWLATYLSQIMHIHLHLKGQIHLFQDYVNTKFTIVGWNCSSCSSCKDVPSYSNFKVSDGGQSQQFSHCARSILKFGWREHKFSAVCVIQINIVQSGCLCVIILLYYPYSAVQQVNPAQAHTKKTFEIKTVKGKWSVSVFCKKCLVWRAGLITATKTCFSAQTAMLFILRSNNKHEALTWAAQMNNPSTDLNMPTASPPIMPLSKIPIIQLFN